MCGEVSRALPVYKFSVSLPGTTVSKLSATLFLSRVGGTVSYFSCARDDLL